MGDFLTAKSAGIAIAFGFIDSDGSKRSGTNNFSSGLRGDGVYEISISGEDYRFASFTAVVTPACNAPVVVGTGSNNGNLLIDTFDLEGIRVRCRFQFAVFES